MTYDIIVKESNFYFMKKLSDIIKEQSNKGEKDNTAFIVTTKVAILKAWYESNKKDSDKKTDFYCGITNDFDERKSQHESQDHNGKAISNYKTIDCKKKNIAVKVEEKMGKMGFDIGNPPHPGNGAVDDTTIVYLYRKPE